MPSQEARRRLSAEPAPLRGRSPTSAQFNRAGDAPPARPPSQNAGAPPTEAAREKARPAWGFSATLNVGARQRSRCRLAELWGVSCPPRWQRRELVDLAPRPGRDADSDSAAPLRLRRKRAGKKEWPLHNGGS
eukprot:2216288-Pyramimonas_sp.AAC.1